MKSDDFYDLKELGERVLPILEEYSNYTVVYFLVSALASTDGVTEDHLILMFENIRKIIEEENES